MALSPNGVVVLKENRPMDGSERFQMDTPGVGQSWEETNFLLFWFNRVCWRLVFLVLLKVIFPQIAGSYRGSYFSMTGLLIPGLPSCS